MDSPERGTAHFEPAVAGGPVFIHCLPRAGSTWLAYKFDNRPDIAFRFEPFHQNLVDGTQASLQAEYERLRCGRSLRHPCRASHYHKDYDFLPEGGVALFEKRFCYQNYYVDQQGQDEQLAAYVRSLFTQPRSGNRRPFIKCTKTALRAPWFSRQFPGTHIYLFRCPRLIDNSYFSFRGFYNPYVRDFALIVGQNRDSRLFADLAKWSALPEFFADTLKLEFAHYRDVLLRGRTQRYDRQYHFDCLCFFWLLGWPWLHGTPI